MTIFGELSTKKFATPIHTPECDENKKCNKKVKGEKLSTLFNKFEKKNLFFYKKKQEHFFKFFLSFKKSMLYLNHSFFQFTRKNKQKQSQLFLYFHNVEN